MESEECKVEKNSLEERVWLYFNEKMTTARSESHSHEYRNLTNATKENI